MSQGAGTDFSEISYTPGRRLSSVALPSLSVLISSTLWPSAARTVKTVAGVGVLFVDDQVGPALVLNGDGAGLAGEQLHMVFLEVKNVVGNRGRLLDGVHARFQIGDVDLAVVIGDAVQVVGPVLHLGDAEMHSAQPGAVRAGLDQAEGGVGGDL